MAGNKIISNSFVVNTVEDPINPPYTQIQEAWSNVSSVPSESTEPVPNSGWSDSTPPKGTWTYLWRRSRLMTFDDVINQYIPGNWTYIRISGENGTSINVKGVVPTPADLYSIQNPENGDSYVVTSDGNLYMWSTENGTWQKLGQFQGQAGVTYFTHIAWASGTTDGTPPARPTGQTTYPNKADVTGFSVAPFTGASWMGILVNQTVDDPAGDEKTLYTWDYVKGANGNSAIYVDLDNENDTMLYTSSGTLVSGNVTSTATLYDGETPHTTSGVTWSIVYSGCTATNKNNVITVSSMSSASGYVIVRGTYNGYTYSSKLTLKKLVGADKYDIVVTPNSITYNSTTGTSYSTSVSVKVYRTTVQGTRSLLNSLPSGFILRYYSGTSSYSTSITYSGGVGTFNTFNSSYSQYRVELIQDTTVYDSETIPINKSANGAPGDPGAQGKMGRNLWYAGMWDDTDVNGKIFTVNDYQAPYVNIGTADSPDCRVWVGANGTYSFPTTVSSYNSTSNWQSMTTAFKYLISNALFSDYASLGSSIFNKDFMMSHYGEVVAYGRTFAPNNKDLYKYADPSDMGVKYVYRYPSAPITSISFNNTDYDENHKVSFSSFSLGYMYMIATRFNVLSGNKIAFKVAATASGSNVMNNGSEYVLSESSTWQYKYLQVTEPDKAGSFSLYYRLTEGTGAIIIDAYKSRAKFRPKIYADWLKGFFSSRYGVFKNVTVEGKINNLITVIDWNNDIGKDKIITAYYKTDNLADFDFSYTADVNYTWKRYYIDILNCGDFIYINSLPETGSGVEYRIPYYALSNLQDRGHTISGEDGNEDPHIMTSDEMRQLIGRRLTFKINLDGSKASGQYQTKMTGMLDLEPFDSGSTKWIANKKNYYRLPVPGSSTPHYQSLTVGLIPQVIHMECIPVTWTNNDSYVSYSGYGYVWVGDCGIDAAYSPTADSIYW